LSQVGASCSAVLWLLDIHLSLLFGSIHFILNFIPNVGAIVATMLPVPLLLISPGVNVMQVCVLHCDWTAPPLTPPLPSSTTREHQEF